ncbi:MAG: hypothetical protein L0K86_05085 [Actinomycetia bacterium]|nr:hypothetical protein [Actinomycetes bacterium]
MSDPNPDDDGGRPPPSDARPYLLVGCGVVALEALTLLALGIAELLSVEADRVGLGVSTAVFFLVIGGGLGWCVRGLWRRSSWVRGPVVLAQLIALGLAWNFRTVSPKVIAVALLIAAIVALVAVLSPATTAALNAEDRRLDSGE